MILKSKFLVTTSWDDGSTYDKKLAALLLKYKIPATFYIPGNCDLTKLQIKNLAKNFEIGGHTMSHPLLTQISVSAAKKEIIRSKNYLENITGKRMISFCYPGGKFNQEIKQVVGLAGFEFGRTTRVFHRSIGDRLLAGTSVHAFDHFYLPWDRLAILYFIFIKYFGGIYHLWGHSWEIEKYNDWNKLERVFEYISANTLIEDRVTNGQIVEKFQLSKMRYYVGKIK